MNLGSVKRKLDGEEYDLRTLFLNSALFHWHGARQFRIATRVRLLSDGFEEKYLDPSYKWSDSDSCKSAESSFASDNEAQV